MSTSKQGAGMGSMRRDQARSALQNGLRLNGVELRTTIEPDGRSYLVSTRLWVGWVCERHTEGHALTYADAEHLGWSQRAALTRAAMLLACRELAVGLKDVMVCRWTLGCGGGALGVTRAPGGSCAASCEPVPACAQCSPRPVRGQRP